MEKYKIKQIVKKQNGACRVIFHDGTSVFWPQDCNHDLTVGTRVREYKNKDGKTVAYNWHDTIRFVVSQPVNLEESMDFVNQFKLIDRVSFGNAVVRALGYKLDQTLFQDKITIAHNLVLLWFQSKYRQNC